MHLLSNGPLYTLIRDSDAVTTLILVLLLTLSILCWTIFIGKTILFMMKKRELKKAYNHIMLLKNLADVTKTLVAQPSSYGNIVLSRFVETVQLLLKSFNNNITPQERELVYYYLEQSVDMVAQEERKWLPLLSTTAGVAPLLGLFGTVWGLIQAFIQISQAQSADIATVAPGIAAALLTTLAGLVVAIPALVMFNYLQVKVEEIEQHLLMIADKINILFQPLTLRSLYAPDQAKAQNAHTPDGHFPHSPY